MEFIFNVPNELLNGIREFCDFFRIKIGAGKKIIGKHSESEFKVIAKGDEIIINYPRDNLFFYGLSFCIENYERRDFEMYRNIPIERLGIMRDCARNASLSVEGAKSLIIIMAALGYDFLELYTEDLFDIKELPYMGKGRGKYSAEQLKEIDGFAKFFGIELIPCVQTLAHLPYLFRNDAFFPIQDIGDILLMDEEKTYEFLETVIRFARNSFSSNNINIGMDEAHLMCMGNWLKKHGYTDNKEDVFLRHLRRVLDICEKYGFNASMWSDMPFKLGIKETHPHPYIGYDTKEFYEGYAEKVPKNVNLIFWEYDHTDSEFYDGVFKKHYQLTDKSKVFFAGGAYTWTGFVPANGYAEKVISVQIEGCIRNGCKNYMLTIWGDGGGETLTFSAISNLVFTAEKSLGGSVELLNLNKRCDTLFGNTYEEFKNIENCNRTHIDSLEKNYAAEKAINPSKYLLYNDPLLGVLDAHVYMELKDFYERNAAEMKKYRDKNGKFAYLFDSFYRLCDCVAEKSTLGIQITEAYREKDFDALRLIADKKIPSVIKKIEKFYEIYRNAYLAENKSYGFEVFDLRIGGLLFRLKDVSRILTDFIDGKVVIIEELESERLPVCTFMKEKEDIRFNSFMLGMTGSGLQ